MLDYATGERKLSLPTMPTKTATSKARKAHPDKLVPEQIAALETRMQLLAERNPSWKIKSDQSDRLYEYLAAQKITYLYDDELYEKFVDVDSNRTGKQEELLDAYLIQEVGEELHLHLFQFKFSKTYDGGISTKELYSFVDRMHRVFLRGDLEDEKTLAAYAEVRKAFDEARTANKRLKSRIRCHFVTNGQRLAVSDRPRLDEMREVYRFDRQTHGFTFEAYAGMDIYDLCEHGRIPIQDEVLELNYEFKDTSVLHHPIGANPSGMPLKAIVGFVNVNQLTRLVDRYSNNELFEKNVRFFLGGAKDVNKRIIGTVTSDQSSWFGFMNNGVSIIADSVHLNLPPAGKKVPVQLVNMQIINGCQTVNALYHAKHDPELRDRFQGNSNVLVRIYEIDPANKAFTDALILATNSQNAIRPEDQVANDPVQKALQELLRTYNIGYERKEGEKLSAKNFLLVLTKEDAALAYLGVFWKKASKLRNSLSRREFFRRNDEESDYAKVYSFQLTGEGALDAKVQQQNRERALQFIAAHVLVQRCRENVTALSSSSRKGALRKAGFYLAGIIHTRNHENLEKAIRAGAAEPPSAKIAQALVAEFQRYVDAGFSGAVNVFERQLRAFVDSNGKDEDAALKNSDFASKVFDAAKTDAPHPELNLTHS
jgi:hypothetical protein